MLQRKLSLQVLFIGILAWSATPAQAETTWSGGTAWRYVVRTFDDSLSTKDGAGRDTSKSTTKSHQLRADLNAANKGERVDWGVGFRTYGSVNSEYLTVIQNADRNITLENAYARPHWDFSGNVVAVTIGRAKTVMIYDSLGQILFDKDNRWDGFGWNWSNGNFGLSASQYILGARSQSTTLSSSSFSRTEATDKVATTTSGFGVLYSVQPNAKFRFSDEIEATFALGYHMWQGTGSGTGFQNGVQGGVPGTAGTSGTAADLTAVTLSNPRQWQLFADFALPMNLHLIGEFVKNKKVFYGTAGSPTNREAKNTAFAASLVYGKVKKAGDISASYTFASRGVGSTVNTFANGDMYSGNTGHLFNVAYGLADGLSLGAKMQLYKEKGNTGGDGLTIASPYQNRREKQNRYEFVAGAAF